jgi:hypothetical protein
MSITSARTIRYRTRQQKKEQQQELERDRLQYINLINSELHEEMQCTAGLCEYCDDKATVCIHNSVTKHYFVHACWAHQWECCLDMAEMGGFGDDDQELIYIVDLGDPPDKRWMGGSTFNGLARDEGFPSEYCR